MLAEFSRIITKARERLMLSPRCLRTPAPVADIHDWDGHIEERALRFLAAHAPNEWWFWYVVEQSALHAIGPRIQLAHVVEAIVRLRRLNEQSLLCEPLQGLSREELALAVATGAAVAAPGSDSVPTPTVHVNPLLDARFDPVQAAVHFGGCRAA